MPESLQYQVDLPVSPERVYRAWLDSHEHSQFTGQPARIENKVGGAYSALDGKIEGEMQVLSPFSRIVQTWRSRDWPQQGPVPEAELTIEPTCLGSLLMLSLTGIPDGKTRQVLDLWGNSYFRPLNRYFEELVGDGPIDMDG
jgi:activator of HSP90 ATPase